MYTRQETFDMSSLAMIRQGRPGVNAWGCCSYVDGCAAAQLVNPDLWLGMAGNADHPLNQKILREAGHDPQVVRQLQVAHDVSAQRVRNAEDDMVDPVAWRAVWVPRLREVAAAFDLSFTAVETAARDAGWEV